MAEFRIGKKNWLVQVDDEDLEKVSLYKWHVHLDDTNVYACRRVFQNGKRKKIYMHRFLMGVTDPDAVVDHDNRDGLDNRKANLIVTTRAENNRNCTKRGQHSYAKNAGGGRLAS